MRIANVLSRTLAMLGLAALTLVAHAEVKAGVDYDVLPEAMPVEVPGKQEVIEFFWYRCPHCEEIQPQVKAWRAKLPKDVVFRTIHVNWGGRNDMEAHAKIYLTLKAMGVLEAQHDAVFDAIFKDNIELRDDAKLYDWAAKRGLDRAKFESIYKSFGIQSQFGQLQKMTTDYRIDGTPTFIVNGKFKTSPAKVGSETRVFTVIDELLAQGRAKPVAAAKPAVKP